MQYGSLAKNLTRGATIVTLVTEKEKHRLATRAVSPTTHQSPASDRRETKLSRADAAKQLAGLVERDMERQRLSEEEKNGRVNRFVAFVKSLKKHSRKS